MIKMYLIVDLEATCWEEKNKKDLNEIIDIGIVVCDNNYDIVETWSSLCKPKVNSVLSPFCRKLTKIKQEEIDSSCFFIDTINSFKEWFCYNFKRQSKDINWYSWGDWDLNCLSNECKRNEIEMPFKDHIDLKEEYSKFYNYKNGEKISLKAISIKEKVEFTQKKHRGLPDAIAAASIAKIIYSS